MSASQDKKRRQTERMEGTDKRTLAEREAAQKAKKERTRWGIVGAIIVVFAVVVILLNTNLFYSGTTAITIGDYKYTNADFQYYYSNAYANFMNSYGSYFSMFDTTQDLDDQAFDPTYITMFGGTVPEGLAEDASWQDYFEGRAICMGYTNTMLWLCEKANLRCSVIRGYASWNGEEHGWNMAYLEDGSYYVDITWCDQHGEPGSEGWNDYFMVTEARLLEDHGIWTGGPATGTVDYS